MPAPATAPAALRRSGLVAASVAALALLLGIVAVVAIWPGLPTAGSIIGSTDPVPLTHPVGPTSPAAPSTAHTMRPVPEADYGFRTTWSSRVAGGGQSDMAIAGDVLALRHRPDRLQGFSLSDGTPLWDVAVGQQPTDSAGSTIFRPPLLGPIQSMGDEAFLAEDGFGTHAFDAETGKERWFSTRPGIAAVEDSSFVFSRTISQLTALDPRTGEPLWQRPGETADVVVELSGGVVVVSSNGMLSAVQRATGAAVWERRLAPAGRVEIAAAGADVVATAPPVLSSDVAATIDVSKVRGADGEVVAVRTLDVHAQYHAPPRADASLVVLPEADGFRGVDARNLDERWTNSVGDIDSTWPAMVAGEFVFVRLVGGMATLRSSDGRVVARFTDPDIRESVTNGRVVCALMGDGAGGSVVRCATVA